jgi:hypothetical protein
MPLMTITTPYGDSYVIHENGNIRRTDLKGFEPSGDWKMLGLVPVEGGPMIPLHRITRAWLDSHPLTYRHGNPKYAVVDLDHGTRRTWGNTEFHGVKTITLHEKAA